jgi:hypothetical protein
MPAVVGQARRVYIHRPMQWHLQIVHVVDQTLPLGTAFLVAPGAVLGRGPDATVRIEHTTISRHHLRWKLAAGPHLLPVTTAAPSVAATAPDIELENASSRSVVFVDGVAIAPQASYRGPTPKRLQLGAVLFSVTEVPATEAFDERIEVAEAQLASTGAPNTTSPAPDAGSSSGERSPLFEITRDGDARAIRCRGRFVDLPPAACRLFARLAEESATVVHRWDLQEVVGPAGNLAQLATTVRQGIRSLLDAGVLDLDELRALIRRASGSGRIEDLGLLDADALLRRLVLSRRGHGYVLCIPPDRIAFTEADS